MPLADITTFFDAIGKFFASFGDIRFGSLFIGLVCFGIYLTVRSRAYFNVLRAAYPAERIQWRRIWGAYVAAYGFKARMDACGDQLGPAIGEIVENGNVMPFFQQGRHQDGPDIAGPPGYQDPFTHRPHYPESR